MTEEAAGILELTGKRGRGPGKLRDPEQMLQPNEDDVIVPQALIQATGLVNGAYVVGPVKVRRGKGGSRVELQAVTEVGKLPPAEFQQRTQVEKLTAISPNQRFDLGVTGDVSMRIIDLISPVGKGTRGLIVAPPKAGKTQILEQMARSLQAGSPEVRVIVLLVDERPEEVTHFRRTVDADVYASSNDRRLEEHIALAELTMAHVRTELECGRDVVVLIDSLTRLTRASNLSGSGSRRTLSGGIDAGALEVPRRMFGLARNIENGGSVTILATALVDTGSRMDDLIFQEFKGTGNSEIILDRELAEARIFPAIDLLASSTRNDDLLYNEAEMVRLVKLRRWLAGGSKRAAMNGLLKLIERTESNTELLARIGAK